MTFFRDRIIKSKIEAIKEIFHDIPEEIAKAALDSANGDVNMATEFIFQKISEIKSDFEGPSPFGRQMSIESNPEEKPGSNPCN